MKKKKPKAHKKTQTRVDKNAKCRAEVQTGAGHKKQTTLTQNISQRKIPSPYKNSNWSRQNHKIAGPSPKPERPKRKSPGPPQKHKWEMKCLWLTWKGREIKDHDVGRRGAWDEFR